jgi:hypothetical protein
MSTWPSRPSTSTPAVAETSSRERQRQHKRGRTGEAQLQRSPAHFLGYLGMPENLPYHEIPLNTFGEFAEMP